MCNKCLYKKNCQFLAKHRKTIVEGCTAFESENKVRAEAIKEFAERLKKNHTAWSLTSPRGGASVASLTIFASDIDKLVKEMTGE